MSKFETLINMDVWFWNLLFLKDLMLVNNDYSYYPNVDIMSYVIQNFNVD